MKNKSNLIDALIAFAGCCLAGVMMYLFFNETDQIAGWFGWSSQPDHGPIGVVEYGRTGLLRKIYSASEFLPLSNHQNVFDRDTVMTDPKSEAILSLYDGSVIQIQPDSLVRLVFQEKNRVDEGLTIEVTKGAVKGNTPTGTLKVIENGKKVVAQPLDLVKAETKVEAFKKKNMAEFCRVEPLPVEINQLSVKNASLVLPLKVVCDEPPEDRAELSIRDESGKVMLSRKELDLSRKSMVVDVPFPHPGKYGAVWNEQKESSQSFSIPQEWTDLKFKSENIDCDGGLRWERGPIASQMPSSGYHVSLGEDEKGVDVTAPVVALDKKINRFPAKIQVRTQGLTPDQGFVWLSPILTVERLRECKDLAFPENGSSIQLKNESVSVIFTWKAVQGNVAVTLELSHAPNFAGNPIKVNTEQNFSKVKLSERGHWYWRVVDRKTGDASNVRDFWIR